MKFQYPRAFPDHAICPVSACETLHFALPLPTRRALRNECGEGDRMLIGADSSRTEPAWPDTSHALALCHVSATALWQHHSEERRLPGSGALVHYLTGRIGNHGRKPLPGPEESRAPLDLIALAWRIHVT